jgi:hypothetical protein
MRSNTESLMRAESLPSKTGCEQSTATSTNAGLGPGVPRRQPHTHHIPAHQANDAETPSFVAYFCISATIAALAPMSRPDNCETVRQ